MAVSYLRYVRKGTGTEECVLQTEETKARKWNKSWPSIICETAESIMQSNLLYGEMIHNQET